MKKVKSSEYSVLIRKVRKTNRGLNVVMSLCKEGGMPFLINFKFTGEVCKELLSKKKIITVKASVTGDKIDLKSITFLSLANSKMEKRTYSLIKNENN